MSSGISELELLAGFLGLTLACVMAQGRPVLLFCDNPGAADTAIRDSRRTALGRKIAAAFWALEARPRRPVWVRGVASRLNSPDAPSRISPLLPAESRFLGEIPPEGTAEMFADSRASRNTLETAQFKGVTVSEERPKGWPCSKR